MASVYSPDFQRHIMSGQDLLGFKLGCKGWHSNLCTVQFSVKPSNGFMKWWF